MNEGDAERVEAFLFGDEAVTQEITSWIRTVVYHRAWRLQRSEDLVQDVLVRLLEALGNGRFEGRSSLRTFVERVAKYTCLDAVRRARRVDFVDLDETGELPAPSDDGVLDRMEADEQAQLCFAVLERLPEGCRDLLQRTLAEGVRYEEIAAAAGVAVGTIKSRVSRCRDRALRLRDQILRQGPESRERGRS